MPFPQSARVVYNRNPLKEVICQLRFPKILRIGTEEPTDFQEQVRAAYPVYSRQHVQPPPPPEVLKTFKEVGISGPWDSSAHQFQLEDSSRFISLTTDFLAITERNYTRWESFREEIEKAQLALEEVYTPAFFTRIGLRYIDVIDREELDLQDESWDQLLDPALVGVLGVADLLDDVRGLETTALLSLENVEGCEIRLRLGLAQSSGEPGANLRVYQVDADLFTRQRSEGDDVLAVLDRFNRVAGNLFRWSISDRLHEALEPRDLD